MTRTYLANAKLNLFLDIVGVRADGYHLLETVMQSVDLADVVEVSDGSSGITVSCSDPNIPSGEGNICHKAAEEFIKAAGVCSGVKIRVEKRIPSGAGMGGGSADAAAVLKGMNELFGDPLGEEKLLEIAARTGADVPFCLVGGTKLCRGIGEVMDDLGGAEMPRIFLIVKPNRSMNTREAFARYDERPVPRKEKIEMYYNVFEELFKDPETEKIKRVLNERGASGACLTGSGSAVFGAFPDEGSALSAAGGFPECFTAVCRAAKAGVIGITEVVK